MIMRTLLRRPSALQCLARAPAQCRISRAIHTVPSLPQHSELVKNGIPGLLSPDGFKIAYTEYHQHLVDNLNGITAGTQVENQEVKNLVIQWARDPVWAYGFNTASMAFNNSFFFKGLNASPDVVSEPSTDLTLAINQSFSSIETLKQDLLASADAMFGPGFVWLVQVNDGTRHRPLRILNTYIAGTPLSHAHYRRQAHDLGSENNDSYADLNKVGSFGVAAKEEKKDKKPLGGVDVVPLLCVNTWQHVYLKDYGVRGKEQYLENWWSKINWQVVQDYVTIVPRSQGIDGRNQFQRY